MLDREILKLDPNNHSSYARMIHNNIRLNNLKEANNNANLLRMKFSKNIKEKYQEYFLLLDRQNKKNDKKNVDTKLDEKNKVEKQPLVNEVKKDIVAKKDDIKNNQITVKEKKSFFNLYNFFYGAITLSFGAAYYIYVFKKKK